MTEKTGSFLRFVFFLLIFKYECKPFCELGCEKITVNYDYLLLEKTINISFIRSLLGNYSEKCLMNVVKKQNPQKITNP